MKETGLMFKAPLVRAILEGRKTQTRRIVKPQPAPDKRFQGWILDSTDRKRIGKASWGHGTGGLVSDIECIGSPCGKPGDRIYVRETWQGPLMSNKEWEDHYFSEAEELPSKFHTTAYCQYAADGGPPPEFTTMDDELVARWKPSIHMPKWAARIWLEITGVRVERLQEITPDNCIAEGAWPVEQRELGRGHEAVSAFRELWESTGGDWAANPWVWVIDFRVLSTTGRPDQ